MQLDGLGTLRIIFGALVFSGFVIAGVLFVIDPGIGRIDVVPAVVVVALGFTGAATGHWVTRRPLSVDSPQALAASYKANLFVAYALNEGPLLVAFALTFVTGDLWPFLLALPMWLVGCSLIAPTEGNLAKRQEEITARGSSLSLKEAVSGLTGSS